LPEVMRDELVEFRFVYHTKATDRKATKTGDRADVDAIPEEDGIEEIQADPYHVEKIITVINNFLEYQDEPIATHILRKKDLYDQISRAAHRMIMVDETGKINWKEKRDLNKQADELMVEIQEWEEKLLKRNESIRLQSNEVKELKRKVLTTLRIENVV
jgi:hypothetical protein